MKRLLLFLWLSVSVCAWSQTELKYRNLSTEDGLPSNYIINMVQDPQGYIWLATGNGLCRHDGYSFDVFKHAKEGNNALLLNNRIRELHQNPNGLLFIRLQGERYSCYDTTGVSLSTSPPRATMPATTATVISRPGATPGCGIPTRDALKSNITMAALKPMSTANAMANCAPTTCATSMPTAGSAYGYVPTADCT